MTAQTRGLTHVESPAYEEPLLGYVVPKRGWTVSCRHVDLPAPDRRHEQRDKRFAGVLLGRLWHGDEIERAFQPVANDVEAQAWVDLEPPALEDDLADVAPCLPMAGGVAADDVIFILGQSVTEADDMLRTLQMALQAIEPRRFVVAGLLLVSRHERRQVGDPKRDGHFSIGARKRSRSVRSSRSRCCSATPAKYSSIRGSSENSQRLRRGGCGCPLEDYAHCLAAVIDALDLGPGHVAGLSWGGTVALELYRHHPELVATLILVDTYAGWKGSLPAEEVRARVEGARQMLSAPADEFDPAFPGLFAGDPPAEFVPLLDEMAAAVRLDSLRTALPVMAEADQRDLLPRITVPTLLIWGELDARSPLTVARQFEQAIAGAKLVVLAGAGHMSNLEQPKAFNHAIREFCRVHPPHSA